MPFVRNSQSEVGVSTVTALCVFRGVWWKAQLSFVGIKGLH